MPCSQPEQRGAAGSLRQWSIEVKSRGLGLIAAKMANSGKKVHKPASLGVFSRKMGDSAQFSADIEEFLPALLSDHVGIEIAQLVESLRDRFPGGCDHGG